MDPILKRQLALLHYQAPEELLGRLISIIPDILQNSAVVARLTPREKNAYLQQHQAVFLAFMIKHLSSSQAKVTVCVHEKIDFDCVIKAEIHNEIVYKMVQLKQLPSHEVKGTVDLQGIIERLRTKYPTSKDLVVAIWINRDIELDFQKLDFGGLRIEQLWFFADSETGEITLDGGLVSDLVNGFKWSGIMKDGVPTINPDRFNVKST